MEREFCKIAFIVPYYGRLPEYFKMWIKSVEHNSQIDFILITDLIIQESCPQNVKVWNWSFDEIQDLFQSKFSFTISLEQPYKLCDYRPAFGFIFEEFLSEYAFWGHCDIDCVMGDLGKFINPLLKDYDVIGKYGHLSLYRNTKEINRYFMEQGAAYSYRDVFANKEAYAFDEISGVKSIFKNSKWKCIFEFKGMADIVTAHKAMRTGRSNVNYLKQIFVWDNGKVYQCYWKDGVVCYKEFAYLHFQKKKPVVCEGIKNSFYIFSDRFIARNDKTLDFDMMEKTAKYHKPVVLFVEKVMWGIKKIIALIRVGKKQRSINNYKRKFVKT